MKDENYKFKRAEMVRWYNPLQLFDTGLKTAISTIVGEYADPRLGATEPTNGKFFDYSCQLQDVSNIKKTASPARVAAVSNDSEEGADGKQHDDYMPDRTKPRDGIWIDYVADVGDGWNSTYAVAYNLAQPELSVGDTKTERGEILIFGGDGVYPTANSDEYGTRLVAPYRMAAVAGGIAPSGVSQNGEIDLKKSPHIFALPGNHDWYDSLTAFKKLFCSKVFNQRIFAGAWRTRQKRSYFTLKLPHGWWLLGIDMQLSHNIDLVQLEYFESIAEQIKKGDQIILCVPEPFWVKAIKYNRFKLNAIAQKEASIQILENLFEQKAQAKIRAYIAGDLHHYRRFAHLRDKTQKITAGGGGAFLHPTHDFEYDELDLNKSNGFKFEKAFPCYKCSKKLDKRNLWFLWNNPKFGGVTALLYPLIAWLMHGEISQKELVEHRHPISHLLTASFWNEAWWTTVTSLIDMPLLTVVVVLLLLGMVFFTDSISKLQKWGGGILHGLTHMAAIFFLGWASYLVSNWAISVWRVQDPTYQNLVWFLFVLLVPAIVGFLVGPIIMGLYLYISLHWFGRHDNEAFSALKIEDYKNFLRMHIAEDKSLTIYAYKIERVPRNWAYHKKGEFLVPDDKNYQEVGLIEKIELQKEEIEPVK